MALTYAASSVFIPASIIHNGPLYIVIPVVAAVIVAKVGYALARGRSPLVGPVVVRCSQGHVFRTTWSPWGSLASLRLGFARLQRCPVGHHWSLVRPVNDVDLTDDDRRALDHDR